MRSYTFIKLLPIALGLVAGALPGPSARVHAAEAIVANAADSSSGALPDLTIDADRLLASVDFKTVMFRSGDCTLSAPDLCVGAAGKRTLMRFDVAVPNIG